MRLTGQPFPLVPLLICPILIASANVAVARVTKPHMEELVASADLIIIGRVQSVQATPPELRRQVGMTCLAIAGAATSALFLWRRKFANTAVVVVACLVGGSLLDVPFGTYRKVAYVSVSSTIKGTHPLADIPIYYEHGYVCDVTRFAAGEECLLFLKSISTGYTLSWYDWGRWNISNGYAQTERMTWNEAAPIAVAELIAMLQELCQKQGESGTQAPSNEQP